MSETLTWDGEELAGAITAEDLGLLRAFATRGANLPMGGVPGTRPYAPIMDELDVTLVWTVVGRIDPDGVPHTDREVGVEQNAEHYRTLFTTGGDPVTGEHDVSLAYAGGTYIGLAQLREHAVVRTGPETVKIVTRLIIADGELAASGS